MTELESARVRISILDTQTRHYAQEIAVLQAEKKQLDAECSDLSAQNSYQAMRIERLEAALRMCCDTGEMAVRNKYDYGGFRRAVETARAILAEDKP
jgi:DNA repair ATPase RecN